MLPPPRERPTPPSRHRGRRTRSIEPLEDRTLLAAPSGADLARAIPLRSPAAVSSGTLAPDAPVFFQIDPAQDARLVARVHAQGILTRLSLLDSQGRVIVQSDGQSASDPDDLIDQHIVAGTAYLELQTLGGSGGYLLSADLSASAEPNKPDGVGDNPEGAIAFADFNGDGLVDFAAPDGIHLGESDGTFAGPRAPLPLPGDVIVTSIVTGSFTGVHGEVDLAVAAIDSAGATQIDYLKGHGDGTFSLDETVSTGDQNEILSLVSGDFKGDGLDGLAFDLRILFGGALGGFDTIGFLADENSEGFTITDDSHFEITPTVLASAHLNGAGRDDLIIAGTAYEDNGSGYKVEAFDFEGIDDLTFLGEADLGMSQPPRALVTGDFNGDGHLDVAVAETGSLEVLDGDGTGMLTAGPTVALGDLAPSTLATGDLNDDGHTDIVVGGTDSSGQGRVRTLLGGGDGTFVAAPPVELGPVGVDAVAPLGNRGAVLPGLVVSEDGPGGDGRVEVLQGEGDGSFNAPSTDPSAPLANGSPLSEAGPMTRGDFNGDGRTDLVIAGLAASGEASLSVLLSNGDGTFHAGSTVPLGDVAVEGLAAGDFNGDGRLDLAVVEADSSLDDQQIVVFLGDGRGQFQAGPSIDLGSPPIHSIVSGDFNGDGRDDLAVAQDEPPSDTQDDQEYIDVFLAKGDATFQAVAPSPVEALGPSVLLSGEFVGDGRDDLAFAANDGNAGSDSDYLVVMPSAGDGTFGFGDQIELGMSLPRTLVTGDFNGDGLPDIAVGEYISEGYGYSYYGGYGPPQTRTPASGAVAVFTNEGNGTFDPSAKVGVGDIDPTQLAAGDFSGDGRDDLVAAGDSATGGTGGIVSLINQGDGTFVTKPLSLGPVELPSIVSGDFGGDGRDDLVVATSSANPVVQVLQGDGSSAAGPTELFNGNALAAKGPFVSGDFNGDGRQDLAEIATDARGDTTLQVLLGDGQGSFALQAAVPILGFTPTGVVSGDFNGDGRGDLVVAGYGPGGAGEIQAFVSAPNGGFDAITPIELTGAIDGGSGGGFTPTELAVGAFDGDGRMDLAVAGYGFDGHAGVDILRGGGDGSFRTMAFVDLGDAAVHGLVAGAFGGGSTDLAVGVNVPDGRGQIDVLRNDGLGDFALEPAIALPGIRLTDLATGDFNGDGLTDIAAVGGDSATGQVVFDLLTAVGDGTFLAHAPMDLGDGFVDGFMEGDFNGDGRDDVAVVTGFGPSRYQVLLGDGDGTFQPPVLSSLSDFPAPTAVGDFNGDGRDDLALMTGGGAAQIAFSLGDGRFAFAGGFTGAIRDTPLVADLGNGSDSVFVVDQAGEILWRKGHSGATGSFDPPVAINPGSPSRAIAFVPMGVGPMIASADVEDNEVTLFEYEEGRFVRVGSLAAGLLPAQVVAGDLNGDGNVDLVIRNAGDGTGMVYLGDGQGDFVRGSDVPIGLGASDIALADVAGAGRLDLIATDQVTGTVGLFPGLGDGSFGAGQVYHAGAGPYGMEVAADGTTGVSSHEGTTAVAAGPFGAGGRTGLVAIDPGTDSFAVLTGLGDGALANPASTFTGTPPLAVATGDFNGDGLGDLAVLNSGGVNVSLNNGRGGFGPPTTYSAGADPTGLSVAVLDGVADLLISDSLGDVLVLLGDGAGRFMPFRNVDQQVALAVATAGPVGSKSFVYADRGMNRVSVQAGASAPTTLGDLAQGILDPSAVMLDDLDGDGIPDLIVANSGGNDIVVYPGLGDGQYGPSRTFPAGTDPVSFSVADVNGDGIPDLVVANQGSNDISILLGQGTGPGWTLKTGVRLKAGFGPSSTVVRDVNGDGIPDILVSDSQANDVLMLKGVGGGFFDDASPTMFATGVYPGPIFVGNFTGQPGQLDLVTVNAGSDNLTEFLGINGGHPVAQTIASGGSTPIAAVMGDFAGTPGVSDLLVANNADGELAFFMGGEEGLSLAQTFEEPGLPNPTALAMDDTGAIYGGSEGVEAAIPIILGFGGGGGGPSTGGGGPGGLVPGALDFVHGGEVFIGGVGENAGEGQPGGGGASAALTTGPTAQQVVLLQPLSQSSLALVATLLSSTSDLSEVEAAGPAVAAAPNQALLKQGAATGGSGEGGTVEADEDVAMPPPRGQDAIDPLARFISGFDQSFEEIRARAHRGALLDEPLAPKPKPQAQLKAIDALLERWTPLVARVGGPLPALAVDLADAGKSLAQAVDAVLSSLDAGNPGAAPPAATSPPRGPSALAIGAIALGVTVLARPAAEALRPPRVPPRRRPPA